MLNPDTIDRCAFTRAVEREIAPDQAPLLEPEIDAIFATSLSVEEAARAIELAHDDLNALASARLDTYTQNQNRAIRGED